MEAPRRADPVAPENPGEALAAVVDNVGALARAELRLLVAEARAFIARFAVGLVLLWLSLLLAQVSAGLLALSPVLLGSQPWPRIVVMLGISLGLSLVVIAFAVRELRRLKDVGNDVNHRESK